VKQSDSELVTAARGGDQAAIGQIYDRYADRLFGFAFSILRDREEAADAVHDVILRSSQRLDQLRDPSRLRPWLFAIARNEVMTRTRQRSRRDDREVPDMAADLPDHDQGLVRDELQTLVWEAADALQPRDRELLELSMQGLEGEELAEALGVKTSHVHVLTSRMRNRMEKAIGSLLVARLGRDDCEELDKLLSDWDGKFTLEVRSKVTRHIEKCDTCTKRRAIACAPGSIAAALPAIIIPVSLRSRTLASVESTQLGNPVNYTNPSSTNWTWDSTSGFPIKVSIAGRFAALMTLVVGGILAITAAVVTTVLIIGSQGGNGNDTVAAANSTTDVASSQIASESNSLSPASSNDDLIVIPTNIVRICNEGENCSITTSLSSEPNGEVKLLGTSEGCTSIFTASHDHLVAKWDRSDWSENKTRTYYAIPDGEAVGDRVCKVVFQWKLSGDSVINEAFSFTFIIKDIDGPTPSPDSTPVPDPTPSPDSTPVPDPTPSPDSTPVPDPTPSPDSTPVPDPTPSPDSTPVPQSNLSVDVTQLGFGANYDTREITLTNSGGSSFGWTMAFDSNPFASATREGVLPPNSSTSVRIIFQRSNLSEGDYLGTLSIVGDGETISVDLTGSVEIPPYIDFYSANPLAIIAVGIGCSTNEVFISAGISETGQLTTVEVLWSKDGVRIEVTSLELVRGTWGGSLHDLENGATPIAYLILRAVDSRGNEATATRKVIVRPCSGN